MLPVSLCLVQQIASTPPSHSTQKQTPCEEKPPEQPTPPHTHPPLAHKASHTAHTLPNNASTPSPRRSTSLPQSLRPPRAQLAQMLRQANPARLVDQRRACSPARRQLCSSWRYLLYLVALICLPDRQRRSWLAWRGGGADVPWLLRGMLL
ncbi:hypothetical protein BKA81DRAFT_57127 [Phyllosticta paracitricarpa]|uniref:Uncharacterized protein n=2 Tax=Phyllosticta TaxID=121621 RepID=A0ABR1MMJ7_9PEZI